MALLVLWVCIGTNVLVPGHHRTSSQTDGQHPNASAASLWWRGGHVPTVWSCEQARAVAPNEMDGMRFTPWNGFVPPLSVAVPDMKSKAINHKVNLTKEVLGKGTFGAVLAVVQRSSRTTRVKAEGRDREVAWRPKSLL